MPVPGRDEKAWNNWLFVLAGDQVSQLLEQIEEVPQTAHIGYRAELASWHEAMRHSRTFSGFLLMLEKASMDVLSQKAPPLDFGKSLARKRLYSACVAIQRAASMPPSLEPTL